jgi:hypothetical protein
MLLPEAKKVWAELDEETATVGRPFEPWRAPLAVARLFDRHGIVGLEKTIREVFSKSTEEKRENPRDYATKVIEALGFLVFGESDNWTCLDNLDKYTEISVTADQVSKTIKDLASPEEDTEWTTPQRIGLIFNSLRIKKQRDQSSTKRTRFRTLRKIDVADMLRSYGLSPNNMSNMSEHVQHVRQSDFTNGATPHVEDSDGFDWETGQQQ